MTDVAKKCPKCNGEMVEGYVLDNAHLYMNVTQWIEGKPQKAKAAFGLLPQPGINPPKGEEMLPISAYRCRSCGFLESYALG